VRIGDLTMRLVVPASEASPYAGSAKPGGGRFHSMALAVDDFAGIEDRLTEAGIGVVTRDASGIWTDPADTLGMRLQLVDATTLDGSLTVG
jgi:hypothetical protein